MQLPFHVQSLSKQLRAKLAAMLLITGHFRKKLFKPSDSSDFVRQYCLIILILDFLFFRNIILCGD